MNVRRILANAVARRVAALLVAAALAWLGLGTVKAQNGTQEHPNQGAAYSACWSWANQAVANALAANTRSEAQTYSGTCTPLTMTSGRVYGYFGRYQSRTSLGAGQWSALLPRSGPAFTWPQGQECSARPAYTGTSAPYSTASGYAVSGSITCNNGCSQTWFNNGDGTFTGMYSASSTVCTSDDLREKCGELGGGYFWNAYAGVCQPPKEKCAAEQTKDPLTGDCKDACPAGMVMDSMGACSNGDGECPAGNVKSPSGACLPGDGQCAAGEARRDNGTCGKDSDGDGQADEDDDNPDNDPEKETASGGDSCDAPPSCSGGAIACMQVKIQWRIDCNTRRNRNVSGGTCGAMPVCTGDKCDALEYASLIQQWRTACHLEKIANAGPGEGGEDSGAMDPVSSAGVLGEDLDPASVKRGSGGGSWDGPPTDINFDASGYGFGNTCPTIPAVSVMGQTIQFDTTVFCDWMRLGGVFVMIMAYLAGLAIVIRT